MYSKMQSAIQISLGIMIGVGSVVSIGGFDYRMMKQRQAVEDKYWETVESRLAAARLKDEEYARRGLVDPGISHIKIQNSLKNGRNRILREPDAAPPPCPCNKE